MLDKHIQLDYKLRIYFTLKHKHKQLGGWELPGQDGEEGGSSLARMGRRVGAPWPGWGGGWELPGQDGEEGGCSLARMALAMDQTRVIFNLPLISATTDDLGDDW